MNVSKKQRFQEIKRKFPEELLANKGFIYTTCRKLGIHRNTYYSWYKEDCYFAEKCDEVIELMGDWVENKLFENIEKNDTVAIKFCLSTKFKNRGYSEKEHFTPEKQYEKTEEDMNILEEYIEKRVQERLKKEINKI